jgi:hypothetical protein
MRSAEPIKVDRFVELLCKFTGGRYFVETGYVLQHPA